MTDDPIELARQRENRRRRLELDMRRAGIGEPIIERVLRMNPDALPGARLRGIRFKSWYDDLPYHRAWISKGRVIRTAGREAWERIPRSEIVKRGRRQFVSYEAAIDYGALRVDVL